MMGSDSTDVFTVRLLLATMMAEMITLFTLGEEHVVSELYHELGSEGGKKEKK